MLRRLISRFGRADRDAREVLAGATSAFFVKALASAAAFLLNVVIARTLGATESGLFFLGFSLIVVFSTFSRVGLDNTVVRFSATFAADNDWRSVNRLYRTSLSATLLVSMLFAAALFVLADFLAVRVFTKPQFGEVLAIMALGLPLLSLFTIQARMLQGRKRVAQSMFVLSAALPLAIIVLIALSGLDSAKTAAVYFVLASGLVLGLGMIWWFVAPEARLLAGSIDNKALLSSCLPLLEVALLTQIVAWSSQLMLGMWATSADVAVFNAAQRTSMLISFVLIAVNSIVSPKFSAMHHRGDKDALRKTTRYSARLLWLVGLPAFGAMVVFAEKILYLFGPEFVVGAAALTILAIGQFVNVATGTVSHLLMMTGHERLLRSSALGAGVLALGLGIWLIPAYGIIGAAVATSVAIMSKNILAAWYVMRRLGVNPVAFWG